MRNRELERLLGVRPGASMPRPPKSFRLLPIPPGGKASPSRNGATAPRRFPRRSRRRLRKLRRCRGPRRHQGGDPPPHRPSVSQAEPVRTLQAEGRRKSSPLWAARLRQDADRESDGRRKRCAVPVGQSRGHHRPIYGEAEKRLHVLFDEARSDTPAIFSSIISTCWRSSRAGLPPEAAPGLDRRADGGTRRDAAQQSGVLDCHGDECAVGYRPGAVPGLALPARALCGPAELRGAQEDPDRRRIANIPGADKVSFDRIARERPAAIRGRICGRSPTGSATRCSRKRSRVRPQTRRLRTALFEEGLRLFGPSTIPWLNRGQDRDEADAASRDAWAPVLSAVSSLNSVIMDAVSNYRLS